LSMASGALSPPSTSTARRIDAYSKPWQKPMLLILGNTNAQLLHPDHKPGSDIPRLRRNAMMHLRHPAERANRRHLCSQRIMRTPTPCTTMRLAMSRKHRDTLLKRTRCPPVNPEKTACKRTDNGKPRRSSAHRSRMHTLGPHHFQSNPL
jgi:hypothetical protein